MGFSQSDRSYLLREINGPLDRSEQKSVIEFAHSLDDAVKISFSEDLVKLRFKQDIDPDQILSGLNNIGIGVFEFIHATSSREALRSAATDVPIVIGDHENSDR